MPGFNQSDKMLLLYQITMPRSTETEPVSDDMCPWSDAFSDKLSYGVAAQFSDEE